MNSFTGKFKVKYTKNGKNFETFAGIGGGTYDEDQAQAHLEYFEHFGKGAVITSVERVQPSEGGPGTLQEAVDRVKRAKATAGTPSGSQTPSSPVSTAELVKKPGNVVK